MDVLIYHREIAEGDFPDSCIQCGGRDTELTPIVLTTSIPVFGGSFQYTNVDLPFCPKHVTPPLVSLKYPGVREFTEEGIIVKNASARFVDALENHRKRRPSRRPSKEKPDQRKVLPASAIKPSLEQERAYRRFAIASIIGAIVLGLLIAGIVFLVTKFNKSSPPGRAPQTPAKKGLAGPPGYAPPGNPKGPKFGPP